MNLDENIFNDILTTIDTLENDINYLSVNPNNPEYFNNVLFNIEVLLGLFIIMPNANLTELFTNLKQTIIYRCASANSLTEDIFDLLMNSIAKIRNHSLIKNFETKEILDFVETVNQKISIKDKKKDTQKKTETNIQNIGRTAEKKSSFPAENISAQQQMSQPQNYSYSFDWNMNLFEDVIGDFIDEANEIIENLDKHLLELEKSPSSIEFLNLIFREIHTLKGNSATIDLQVMNLVAHRAENILDNIRKQKLKLSPEIIDTLLECNDIFKKIMEKILAQEIPRIDISAVLIKLDSIISSGDNTIPVTVKTEPTVQSSKGSDSTKSDFAAPRQSEKISPPTAVAPVVSAAVMVSSEDYKSIPEWDKSLCEDILDDFITECEEIIVSLDKGLLELERNPDNKENMNSVFRSMHTLKGGSATINLKIMNLVAHRAENILDRVRKNTMTLSSDIIDIMLKCNDLYKEIIEKIKNNEQPIVNIEPIIQKLDIIGSAGNSPDLQKENIFITAVTPRKEESIPKQEEKIVIENLVKPSAEVLPLFKEEKPKVAAVETKSGSAPPTGSSSSILSASAAAAGGSKKIESASLRVDINKLNTAMNQIGEIVIDKIRLNQKIKKLSDLNNLINNIKSLFEGDEKSFYEENCQITIEDKVSEYMNNIKIDAGLYKLYEKEIAKLEEIVDKLKKEQFDYEVEEKIIEKENIVSELKRIGQIFKDSIHELLFIVEHLSLITNELQEGIMKLRMVPVSQLFDKVPRIVRTISKELNKKIEIKVIGEETDLDKTVIEQLNDPLMHLIRNSVDHGIEDPAVRLKKNKKEEGTILLKAEHKGNQVEIIIEDDGKGIDENVILKKAVSVGLVSAEKAAAMKKSEIIELIFVPGFSSAEKVTEISGRGVGMDVVLSNIKKLKGTIEIDTEVNKGTTTTIRLPLTMAIMQVQLIKCSGQIFAIPINFIEEIIKINLKDIEYIGLKSVYNLRNEIVALVKLNDILGLDSIEHSEKEQCQVVIIKISDKRIGFIIDDIVFQQEIVIKSLGSILKNVKHISGATILGEGNVVLILDVLGLYSSAKKVINNFSFDNEKNQSIETAVERASNLDRPQKKILVVDDSKVMRASLRSNLSEAGYRVVEAADGLDALEKLNQETFDLFTVDVMMPQMNGYTLVKKIREIPEYAKKPIIMVSSKSEKIDKMRGLDAGADEYVFKPYEKNKLVQLVKKFLDN